MVSSKAFPYAHAMRTPLSESTRHMPPMNKRGSSITQGRGTLPCETATMPNNPISLEVSKPRPNKNPTGNICQGCLMPSNNPGQHLMKKPTAGCEWPPYFVPSFHACHNSREVNKFSVPTTRRKLPEIEAPNTPPTVVKSCRRDFMKSLATTTAAHMIVTTLECPSAKKRPTVAGRLPATVSLRVTLSMAAMWSASTACRKPKA
mmetsp:Transcript_50798/g.148021  ORF Transcript_50798/g.148021 Transcript_50798/m.148021 type:complete len:204 (+) Transcript_50798:495-1106(+)